MGWGNRVSSRSSKGLGSSGGGGGLNSGLSFTWLADDEDGLHDAPAPNGGVQGGVSDAHVQLVSGSSSSGGGSGSSGNRSGSANIDSAHSRSSSSSSSSSSSGSAYIESAHGSSSKRMLPSPPRFIGSVKATAVKGVCVCACVYVLLWGCVLAWRFGAIFCRYLANRLG